MLSGQFRAHDVSAAVVEFDHLLQGRHPTVVHVRTGKLDVAQARHLEGAIDRKPHFREIVFPEFGIQRHGIIRTPGDVNARHVRFGQEHFKPTRIREQGPAAHIVDAIAGKITIVNSFHVLGGKGERRAVRVFAPVLPGARGRGRLDAEPRY